MVVTNRVRDMLVAGNLGVFCFVFLCDPVPERVLSLSFFMSCSMFALDGTLQANLFLCHSHQISLNQGICGVYYGY